MYKKTVTFQDWDGNTQTEEFYFNMTKAELMELEVSEKDGYSETMQMIIKAGDGKEIIAGFKRLLLMSIGERRGKGFVKNDEIRETFESSPAFSDIFMELATDASVGAEFVNGVIPADLARQVQGQMELKEIEEQVVQLPPDEPQTAPVSEENIANITTAAEAPDFANMSAEDFETWRQNNT